MEESYSVGNGAVGHDGVGSADWKGFGWSVVGRWRGSWLKVEGP